METLSGARPNTFLPVKGGRFGGVPPLNEGPRRVGIEGALVRFYEHFIANQGRGRVWGAAELVKGRHGKT